MAKDSVNLNGLSEQITIINMNMKDFANSNYFESFDLITCNPPYFKVNDKNYFNDSYEKMVARHEVEINLSDLFVVARKLLKNNGNLIAPNVFHDLLPCANEFLSLIFHAAAEDFSAFLQKLQNKQSKAQC